MVFNEITEVVNTFRVFEIYEPQDPWLSFTRATQITTKAEHLVQFNNYLIASSVGTITIDVDRDYDNTIPYDLFSPMSLELTKEIGNWLFNLPSTTLIIVNTSNDLQLIAVKGKSRLTSELFEILLVLDAEGNVVAVQPTNFDDSVSISSGGSGGVYLFTGPKGNYIICVSESCGMRNGKVIIEEVE